MDGGRSTSYTRNVVRISLALLVAALGLASATGCTSVSSSAVRTDGGYARKHLGPVRIYAVVPPEGARVIGMIEVHAVNEEANVERLMPEFVRRVAELGGTGGVIDQVQTHYEMRTEYRTESYAVPCGRGSTCWSTRIVPYTYQIRVLSIQGRALLPADAPAPPGAAPYPSIPPPSVPGGPPPSPPAPTPAPPSEDEGGTSL